MKPDMRKIAKLSQEDRTKVKGYWSPLWGKEFGTAMTTDYKPQGKTKKVEATAKKNPFVLG